MRHTRRIHQERLEVRLDRVQIVWLTLGGVVALGLMFALGMVAGRRAERLTNAAPTGKIAQIDADRALHEQMKFYSELTKKQETAAAKNITPSPKAVLAAPKPKKKINEAQPTAPNPAKALARAVARARDTAVKKPAAENQPKAPPAKAQLKSQLAEGPAQKGEFTVQVSAFQTREEADAYTAGLRRKGFEPFVVHAKLPGRGSWYRVRMGRFTDEDSAKQAKRLLATADIPAWVLRTE